MPRCKSSTPGHTKHTKPRVEKEEVVPFNQVLPEKGWGIGVSDDDDGSCYCMENDDEVIVFKLKKDAVAWLKTNDIDDGTDWVPVKFG